MSQTHVESRGHAVWLACIIAPIITGCFVLARAYTKIFITKTLFLSDYVCFATMVCAVVYCALLAQATYTGMGDRVLTDPVLEEGYYFWIMVSSEFYALSLMGYKCTLLLLYIQVFGVNKKFRIACYIVLFYVVGYLLCNMITEVAGCHPISKFWNPAVPGTCINYIAAGIAYGVGHISSDLIIAILPLPMIWRLKLANGREKLGLALVLGSGAIAFGVAMVRYTYACVDLNAGPNRVWIAGMTFLWSVLEVNTGIICGCTPTLKPLFKYFRESARNFSVTSINDSKRAGSFDKVQYMSTFSDEESQSLSEKSRGISPSREMIAEHVLKTPNQV